MSSISKKAKGNAQLEEEPAMKVNLASKMMHAGAKAAELGCEVERLKTALSESAAERIEDGLHAAKRAAERGRHAAEDLTEETVYRIKRDPLRAVGITLGVGFALGSLVVWGASRLLGRRRDASARDAEDS